MIRLSFFTLFEYVHCLNYVVISSENGQELASSLQSRSNNELETFVKSFTILSD